MADLKITELTALTTPNDADLFVIVDDVSGTATTKKITLTNAMKGITVNGALGGTTWTGTGKISTTVTTEQLRLSYDATNYATWTVAADGALTLVTVDAAAAEADINFNPDGNVGVKTAAPSVALEVTGGIKASGDVDVGDDVLLADGAVIGITGNEIMTWDAAGTITFSGASVVIGTIATGLNFSGSYTTTAIQLGTSGSKMTLAAHDDHAIDINTTCASTDGGNSVRPIHMISTMTGAAGVGGRAEFQTTVSAALGGWANALKAYMVITDSTGSVSGLGSAVVSELLLPGNALSTGTYAVNEMELVTQASGVYTSPTSFMWMQVSGDQTATDTWEDSGYVMTLEGLSEGTGNIFSAGADVAAAATLRIKIGSTPYYILLGAGEST